MGAISREYWQKPISPAETPQCLNIALNILVKLWLLSSETKQFFPGPVAPVYVAYELVKIAVEMWSCCINRQRDKQTNPKDLHASRNVHFMKFYENSSSITQWTNDRRVKRNLRGWGNNYLSASRLKIYQPFGATHDMRYKTHYTLTYPDIYCMWIIESSCIISIMSKRRIALAYTVLAKKRTKRTAH